MRNEGSGLTLGSLFDGIGGFPLAGVMCGIRPVWSSEIEPFPLKVTAARFPGMKQHGSVTDIDGGAVEPVDIITFGSPCQDLSVAGKQLGIHDGQRSNLFFEAVRIIKEMRAADEARGRTGKHGGNISEGNVCPEGTGGGQSGGFGRRHLRPRFAVWENVPGAFSSNKGADFKAVLEALAGVREDGVDVPQPKWWNTGGGILGNGWSIAWRVYDAQYWGVPQRRKRIYLVADFAGERAPEILFEREGVRGDIAQGREAREGTAADAAGGAGGGGGVWIAAFMGGQGAKARHDSNPCVDRGQNVVCYAPNGNHCGHYEEINVSATLETKYHFGSGGDAAMVCYDARGNGDGETAPTLTGDHERRVTDYTAVCVGNGQMCNITMQPVANTLDCMHDQQAVLMDGEPPRKYIVRRLTPTECARLQGFPDEWCEGLGGSDSAIYKAYGNGLALPCAFDVMQRIARFVERETAPNGA